MCQKNKKTPETVFLFREHKKQSHQLPDDHSLLLRKEHGTVGNVEGLVECRYVAQGRVNAVLAERMNVNLCKAGSLLVADVLAPDRSI